MLVKSDQIKVDLSLAQDHLFDDDEFREAYFEANSRSCRISCMIDDDVIPDHDPVRLAELLLEKLKLFRWSQNEIDQFLTGFDCKK